MDRQLATEFLGHGTIPEPGGKLGVPLPAQGTRTPGHGMMASVAVGRRNASGARHLGENTVMHGRTAIHHESKLQDYPGRLYQRIGPGVDLAQSQRPFWRSRKCKFTLVQSIGSHNATRFPSSKCRGRTAGVSLPQRTAHHPTARIKTCIKQSCIKTYQCTYLSVVVRCCSCQTWAAGANGRLPSFGGPQI